VSDFPVLSLEQIHFAYAGGREIFRGLNFALYAGEQVGLYGPNGSGKTTLFRLIAGLEKPGRGRVLLHGLPVLTEKDWRGLRCKVGLVLQQAEDQLFCPTVLEDVAFGPLNLGLDKESARNAALKVLQDLGLEGFEERLTHKLSGGEKKMVALAGVLAMRPEVLLLDEPAGGLDPESEKRIVRILDNLASARIVISHDRGFLDKISTRLLHIEEGALV
jgi:cobalt/nickel transport system ATP-binding protein